MLVEVFLALLQAATEFFPVSSSGHLALFANLFSEVDLFFFTVLHLASLVAVIIFTRREIVDLLSFRSDVRPLWLYVMVGTVPAAFVGFFFNDLIEGVFSSLLFLSVAFLFTGVVLLATRNCSGSSSLSFRSAFFIGLFQVFALFPGVSRSGMTISSARFLGVDRVRAAKFSFLLLIPLVLGAVVLEFGSAYFSVSLVVSFFVALFASLLFLNLLMKVILHDKFWLFGVYCLFLSLVSFFLWFL